MFIQDCQWRVEDARKQPADAHSLEIVHFVILGFILLFDAEVAPPNCHCCRWVRRQ